MPVLGLSCAVEGWPDELWRRAIPARVITNDLTDWCQLLWFRVALQCQPLPKNRRWVDCGATRFNQFDPARIAVMQTYASTKWMSPTAGNFEFV